MIEIQLIGAINNPGIKQVDESISDGMLGGL